MRQYATPRYSRPRYYSREHRNPGIILGELKKGPRTAVELADALYGDRPDGGPDWALSCVRVAIHWLRKQGCEIAPGYKLISTEWEIDMADEVPVPTTTPKPAPTDAQKLEAALDVIKSQAARMNEQGRTLNYTTRRNMDLAAAIQVERDRTNHITRDLVKCLKLAGIDGVSVEINRAKETTVIQVADRKISNKDAPAEAAAT